MNNYMKMIFCAFFFSMNLSAQVTNWYEKNLSAYTEFLKKGFGIETKTPDGFTDLNQYYVGWMAHYNRSGGSGNI